MYQGQLMIVEIAADESGRHGLQTQSGRTECWLDGWIAVPDELAEAVWNSGGWCDLELGTQAVEVTEQVENPETGAPKTVTRREERTVLVDVTPRERPVVELEEPGPTETEQLRADVDYIAAMTGVIL